MTPQLEGTLEILQVDLAGRQLRLALERRIEVPVLRRRARQRLA